MTQRSLFLLYVLLQKQATKLQRNASDVPLTFICFFIRGCPTNYATYLFMRMNLHPLSKSHHISFSHLFFILLFHQKN